MHTLSLSSMWIQDEQQYTTKQMMKLKTTIIFYTTRKRQLKTLLRQVKDDIRIYQQDKKICRSHSETKRHGKCR